ncbi:MAG: TRAP transporter fused permease subunit [Rhodospirillales bacterium]|nr:TRAP transporter fused permease subunit [Rhodospirillales bacterium]
MAVGITVISLAWGLEFYQWLGLNLYPAQIVSAILGLTMALTFLTFPARRKGPRGKVPWYDYLAALVAFVAGGYLAVRYPELADMTMETPWDSVTVGLIIVPMTLEALRRATGYALPIIVSLFVLYGLFGHLIPGQFAAQKSEWDFFVGFLALDGSALMGGPILVACTIVVAFIFFGNLLNVTQGSQFFTELAQVLMGRFRGGSAKIAVVASALFGSISGSAVANVVATGVVTIPMIKKGGYPAHKAAAIEAAASTGGQLLPPVMGAAAFLMADFLEMEYADIVIAALVPGLLYYLALFFQADLEAAREGLARLKPAEIPRARVLVGGWFFAVPFILLILGLFVYNMLPQKAAILSSAVLLAFSLVFGFRGFRPGIKAIFETFRRTGMAVVDLILICAGAGMVIGVLSNSGLGFTFTNVLVQLGSGNLPLLLVLAAGVCIVLGMGLPTLGVYVLLAALVAPGLVEVGVEPIAAHLYVMYFGMMSMLTPPVAIAAFAAAGIANSDPMRTALASVKFGWLAYVIPFLFVLSPTLILIGDVSAVVISVTTAILGVWLVSIGFAGYFLRPIKLGLKAIFVMLGIMALLPVGAFDGSSYIAAIGCVVGLALVGYEVIVSRRASGGSAA